MEPNDYTYFQKDQVQIRFNDIDLMGHVNNATIQEYFDLGRMYYLQRVFGSELKWDRTVLVVASIKTDFLMPIYLKHQLTVETKVTKIGDKSLTMVQVINDNKGLTKATCQSVMVAVDTQAKESTLFPIEWRQLINTIETDMSF